MFRIFSPGDEGYFMIGYDFLLMSLLESYKRPLFNSNTLFHEQLT